MKIIRPIDIDLIRDRDIKNCASVQLGNHCMEDYVATTDFKCFEVRLEEYDINRLFIIYEKNLAPLTSGSSCRLIDIIPEKAKEVERVKSFLNDSFNLLEKTEFEPILVGWDIQESPLIIIDGNHRVISHYIKNNNITDLIVFVCINNQDLKSWMFVPPDARK